MLLRSHVEQVVVEGGRAAGVRLRGSGGSSDGAAAEVIRARRAVVSNASVWDTLRLLPEGGLGRRWVHRVCSVLARVHVACMRCKQLPCRHLLQTSL